ncbi:MAG: sigma-54-dependent transcriptional regulator [Hyphomicrobiales bacterium]
MSARRKAEPRGSILVVEDDVEMRSLLEDELREASFDVRTAGDGSEALEVLTRAEVDVVVTDLQMPGLRGQDLLAEVRVREPELPVVIITAFGSIESAVLAMQTGAYHYIPKPFRMEQLLLTVENALRERRLLQDLERRRGVSAQGRTALVAESPSMRRVLETIGRAAAVDTPFLLLGESGTGKEMLARALHAESPRREHPFLAINCAAIPETLLESQLFGYRRGAFTDAREDRRGLFQAAEGGTIFLDEIGDMPLLLQGKLLRVLQEREVHPLGAAAPVRVDVRIVAATHRDLETLAASDRFRRDLYYRLNVIGVRIPPLRERPEDLIPLAAHFLEKHGARLHREGATLLPEALALLRAYPWPGNVRELENVIERALVLGRKDAIGPEDLPATLRGTAGAVTTGGVPPASLAEMEREHILRTLRAAGGNRAAAARILALDRKTLYRKLKLYGIQS